MRAATAIFLLIALALSAFGFTAYSWAGWRPASCLPAQCFCEAIRPGPLAQPVNAYSNLAYVLAGLASLGSVSSAATRPNLFGQRRIYVWLYAGALVLIGLGSWLYHASLTFVGQWFDVMGMYLLGTFLCLYAAARLGLLGGRPFAWAYVSINCSLGVILIIAPQLRRLIFGGMIAGAVILEAAVHLRRRPVIRGRYFTAALACMVVAYGIWTLDNLRLLCWPSSWFQGHALWHVLTAAAAWLVYLYYRSEKETRIGCL